MKSKRLLTALIAWLTLGSIHLLADVEWIDTDYDGYGDTLQLDTFVVNGNDPETFDWEGYFDFIEANGLNQEDADHGFDYIFGYGAGGTGGTGTDLGSDSTNNTYPFRQTTNAACGPNAVRNVVHIMKNLNPSEVEVATKMASKIGDFAFNLFGADGDGVTKPTTQLNGGLNDYGLKAEKSGWSGPTEATAKFEAAATNGEVMIVGTTLNMRSHLLVLKPYFNSNNELRVEQIDSGTNNNGNATVTDYSPTTAAAIPNNVSGETGQVWIISDYTPGS